MTRKLKYTREEIVEIIRRFHHEKGRIPKYEEFSKKDGYPSHFTVQKLFGSWNNAIKEAGFDVSKMTNLTDEELIEYLRKYEVEYGKPPSKRDLCLSHYPSYFAFQSHFGTIEKAKKLVGQDLDSRARKGFADHPKQKARLAEIFVIEHFKDDGAIDLSGENCTSPVDGICPKKYIYDVKSSSLRHYRGDDYYGFNLDKAGKVDFYYLLAFNENYTELEHVWRIPCNYTEKIHLDIKLKDIPNMKNYEITEKFKKAFDERKESKFGHI